MAYDSDSSRLGGARSGGQDRRPVSAFSFHLAATARPVAHVFAPIRRRTGQKSPCEGPLDARMNASKCQPRLLIVEGRRHRRPFLWATRWLRTCRRRTHVYTRPRSAPFGLSSTHWPCTHRPNPEADYLYAYAARRGLAPSLMACQRSCRSTVHGVNRDHAFQLQAAHLNKHFPPKRAVLRTVRRFANRYFKCFFHLPA